MINTRGKIADVAFATLLTLAAILSIFSLVFYAGAYRLTTDWMLSNFGISVQHIGLAGCSIYFIPAFALSAYFRRDIQMYRQELIDLELAVIDQANSYAAHELPKVIKEYRFSTRLFAGLIALLVTCIVARAFFIDSTYPKIEINLETQSEWPDVAKVELSNISYPLGIGKVLDNGRFISVMPLGDAAIDGKIRLVVEMQSQSAIQADMDMEDVARSGLFSGYIVKNGLSGQAFGILERENIPMAEPFYALTSDPPLSRKGILTLIILFTIIIIFGTLISIVVTWRRKNKLQRDLIDG